MTDLLTFRCDISITNGVPEFIGPNGLNVNGRDVHRRRTAFVQHFNSIRARVHAFSIIFILIFPYIFMHSHVSEWYPYILFPFCQPSFHIHSFAFTWQCIWHVRIGRARHHTWTRFFLCMPYLSWLHSSSGLAFRFFVLNIFTAFL